MLLITASHIYLGQTCCDHFFLVTSFEPLFDMHFQIKHLSVSMKSFLHHEDASDFLFIRFLSLYWHCLPLGGVHSLKFTHIPVHINTCWTVWFSLFHYFENKRVIEQTYSPVSPNLTLCSQEYWIFGLWILMIQFLIPENTNWILGKEIINVDVVFVEAKNKDKYYRTCNNSKSVGKS